jgi:hypothetical protein
MPVKTILVLAANPASTSRLRLDEEVREIDYALKHREQFRLVQKWAVRSRDFYLAILEHRPQIVHFCGHGTGVDGIVLEDETGQPAPLEKEALSRLFKLFAVKGVECVILNACYSEEQAQAISQYIKYVIGMNQAIGDKAAIAFRFSREARAPDTAPGLTSFRYRAKASRTTSASFLPVAAAICLIWSCQLVGTRHPTIGDSAITAHPAINCTSRIAYYSCNR